MNNFSILIKPTSADCNLHCDYCFYLQNSNLYPEIKHHRMSDGVLEELIMKFLGTRQPAYSFIWQGGEPLLMGLNFFNKVTFFQIEHCKPGSMIGNCLQTNATLVTQDLAKHFKQYNYLLGCSLDGPKDHHDHYRKNIHGESSHSQVLRGINILKQNNVDFNILTMVSKSNVGHIHEVYRYLLSQGCYYHQYIPCMEFDSKGNLSPFSISGKEWGDSMCELFDLWYQKDAFKVSIRHFDSVLLRMVDGITSLCNMGTNCCQYLVVEYNGDVYPCDFFVRKHLKLGNIMENSFEEMINSKQYRDFGLQKGQWNRACQLCDCVDLCAGDCIKYRIYGHNHSQNLSLLCEGWKQFYQYTRSRFERLALKVADQRRASR